MLKETTPFDTKDPIRLLISNIISSSIFGQRYKSDDPEFLKFREMAATFQTEFGNGSTGDFIPFLRPFYGSEKRIKAATAIGIGFLSQKLQAHITSYEPGVVRDVIDSLLSAREEVIAEGKEAASYLTEKNMTYMIFDLFFASIETTQIASRWILLYLANYQDIQDKVIEELRDQIGDRIPVQEDRKRCPYTAAVITEVLRIRNSTPFLLPHKAMCNSQIGGHTIPKGTGVVFNVNTVHKDPSLWENPERFYPERFLENDGRHTETRLSQYMPFGQGRRSCIGEKLAIEELFLVIAAIFRRCRIYLKEPPEDMEAMDLAIFTMPKDYKIITAPL